MLYKHFNSIKVRLKLRNATGIVGDLLFQFHKGTIKTGQSVLTLVFEKFQFHKGTIKTIQARINQMASSAFQFHKGTIKTNSNTLTKLLVLYFNSIKVRLKRGCAQQGRPHAIISIP